VCVCMYTCECVQPYFKARGKGAILILNVFCLVMATLIFHIVWVFSAFLTCTADEPTTGMDPRIRRDIWNLILKMKENRVTIMTTHVSVE